MQLGQGEVDLYLGGRGISGGNDGILEEVLFWKVRCRSCLLGLVKL